MQVSILIPCHNEEQSIKECVLSCLNQTRKPDQILVVNDGSIDRSGEILAEFGDQIQVLTIPVATGNKSYAQQRGLEHITGDVFIATDGDTILDKHLVEEAVYTLEKHSDVVAVCGYVKSLKFNWLTACREIEYFIGQNLYKVAQSYLDAVFVIPGCAGAFRTNLFREKLTFDHDTLTEDLDFTYKVHILGLHIAYNKKMIAYTQDPATLSSYINQIRRWYCGGWQNLRKHFGQVVKKPMNAFQLSLNYIEGFVFSVAFFVAPIINVRFFEYLVLPFITFMVIIGAFAAVSRKRFDLLYYAPTYLLLVYINVYIFLEQFILEIVIRKDNLTWFHPERRSINI